MTPATLARICARHHLTRRDVLIVTIFLRAYPKMSFTRALWDYLHGVGPAAVAAGRIPRRLAPPLPPVVPWWERHDRASETAA